VITLEGGAQSHKIVKVSKAELAQWDSTHDAVGREKVSTTVGRLSDKEAAETTV
jgi:hypothetical protein